jgi:hypothetical protein
VLSHIDLREAHVTKVGTNDMVAQPSHYHAVAIGRKDCSEVHTHSLGEEIFHH